MEGRSALSQGRPVRLEAPARIRIMQHMYHPQHPTFQHSLTPSPRPQVGPALVVGPAQPQMQQMQEMRQPAGTSDTEMEVRSAEWLQKNIDTLSKVGTLNQKSMTLRTSRIFGVQDGDESLVSEMNDYLTTIGVVSALILSVTLGVNYTALEPSANIRDSFEPSEETLENVIITFQVLMFFSTACSLLAIVLSVNLYIDLNTLMTTGVSVAEILSPACPMTPAVDPNVSPGTTLRDPKCSTLPACMPEDNKLWFIRNSNMQVAEALMSGSLCVMALCLPLGIFVVQGLTTCIICTAIGILCILIFVAWYMRYHSRMRVYLKPFYQEQAKILKRELAELKGHRY